MIKKETFTAVEKNGAPKTTIASFCDVNSTLLFAVFINSVPVNERSMGLRQGWTPLIEQGCYRIVTLSLSIDYLLYVRYLVRFSAASTAQHDFFLVIFSYVTEHDPLMRLSWTSRKKRASVSDRAVYFSRAHSAHAAADCRIIQRCCCCCCLLMYGLLSTVYGYTLFAAFYCCSPVLVPRNIYILLHYCWLLEQSMCVCIYILLNYTGGMVL